MANEIGPVLYASGASLRGVLTNEAGQVRDLVAGAWVAAAGATFADCLIVLAEQGATGRYYADLPAGFASSARYNVAVMLSTATGFADQASLILEGIVEPQGAIPGDAMTLTGAYDAAKVAADQASVNAIPTTPLLTNDARLNNLDATISSRNATAPDNAGIAAIKAKTDGLPADPASNTQVNTRLAAAEYTDPASAAEIAASVCGYAERTLSGFGALVQQVWEYAARRLTGGEFIDADRAKLDGLVAVKPDYKPAVDAQGRVTTANPGPDPRGPGASACTLTTTASGQAVADADVWITSDASGLAIVAGTLQTNSQGKAMFLLDAGTTYYLWMQKDGVNPIQGQAFVAEAD